MLEQTNKAVFFSDHLKYLIKLGLVLGLVLFDLLIAKDL